MSPPKPPLPGLLGPWIQGAWQPPGAGSATLPVVDPATAEVLAQLAADSPKTVAAAVAAARETFQAGTWSRRSIAQRQQVLRSFLKVIGEGRLQDSEPRNLPVEALPLGRLR